MYFTNTKSVASYYDDLSEGKMAISGDVHGWYTLTANTSTCDYSEWSSAAREAAAAAGVDLSVYTNLVYAFPKQKSCWWSGLANLPGKNSWLNGTTSLFITSHELGHNFGVHHASTLTCRSGGSRVQYSSNCTTDEYGDPFDIMGYKGQRHMNNWHRWQIGFFDSSDVQTVTAHGTYRVATAEFADGVPRVLRVARPSGDYYYLEFRQPYAPFDDFSSTAAVVNGVSIRIAPHLARVQSKLLDANPATTAFSDSAVAVGQTFSDSINQIYVTTLSIAPDAATVLVQVGPDIVPPTAPTGLTAKARADSSVKLTWSASSDDLVVTGYRVSRNGVELGAATTPVFVDLAPPQGITHSYSVVALDRGPNASLPTAVSVFVPDTTAPSAPGSVTATAVGPTSVSLNWLPATDNLGVTGYVVSRDGQQIATTQQTQAVDSAAADGKLNNYAVRALDAVGNVGPPGSASFTLPDVTAPTLAGALVGAADGTGAVNLTWTAASDNVGVVRYELTRDGAPLPPVSQPAFVDKGLAQARTYAYGVVAVDTAGHRSATLTASVYVPDVTPPTASASLVASLANSRSVDLAWPAAQDNVGVVRYRVLRNGALVTTVTGTSLNSISVEDGRNHVFEVVAVDAAGNRGPAARTTISVPDVTAPTAPVLSAVAHASTSVELKWTASTDNVGVTGYVVSRAGVAVASVGPGTTSYVDGSLSSGRTYTYSVAARDAAGNVSTSLSATVALTTADFTPPSKPLGLTGQPLGRRRVSLTWQASTDDRQGTLRYQVFRGRRKIATVTETAYVDRPAKVGLYKYRVRAVDAAGNKSSFSAAIWVRAKRRV